MSATTATRLAAMGSGWTTKRKRTRGMKRNRATPPHWSAATLGAPAALSTGSLGGASAIGELVGDDAAASAVDRRQAGRELPRRVGEELRAVETEGRLFEVGGEGLV